MDIIKGSEGVFGVVTELTIKIFRYMPENRRYFGYIFPDWPTAVDFAPRGLPGTVRAARGVSHLGRGRD